MNDKYIVSAYGNNWYIVNTSNNRKRKVGPFRWSGKNYYDEAKELAAKRMGCKPDEVEYVPDYIETRAKLGLKI